MLPRRYAGLEKITIGTGFMVVGDHVRQPAMVFDDPCARLRVDQRQPVAVQVKPVMIGAAIGPVLDMLAMQRVADRVNVPAMVVPGAHCANITSVRPLYFTPAATAENVTPSITGSAGNDAGAKGDTLPMSAISIGPV